MQREKERERERDWFKHILFVRSQKGLDVTRMSYKSSPRERERERERETETQTQTDRNREGE